MRSWREENLWEWKGEVGEDKDEGGGGGEEEAAAA